MPTSCQDVSAKMMELLYGELPEGERAPIDAHVSECARCRAELEAFQRTRAVARRALDEAPPARAREAILRAAAAAAASVATAEAEPARAVASMARPHTEPGAKAEPERSSFWSWLRGRWTLPTFATVGAVAVFLLGSRLFMEPAKTFERGKQGISPVAPSETPTSPAVGPGAASESDVESARARAEGLAQEKAKVAAASKAELRDLKAAAPQPVGASAPAADANSAPRRRAGSADKPSALKDQNGGEMLGLVGRSTSAMDVGGGLASGPPGLRGAGSAAPADRFTELPPKAKAEKKTAARDDGDGAKGDAYLFAPPPPPRAPLVASRPAATVAAPAPAAERREREVPKPKVAGKHELADDPLEGFAQERRAETAGIAPKSPAPVAAAEPSAGVSANAHHKGSGAGPSETLRERADRLFVEGRWAEAAAAYRELLRGDPNSPDADRWRQRLAAATRADAEAPAASRAAVRAPAKAEKRSAPEKQPTR